MVAGSDDACVERARCWVDGCERIRLHDLRHAHPTMLLELDVPLHVVSGRFGHGAETTAARTYAHFVERSDRAADDLIGVLVRAGAGDIPAKNLPGNVTSA